MQNDAQILADLKARYPILSLDDLRKLPEAEEYDAGVYFLWHGDQLQYIGKSSHVLNRLVYQQQVNRYAPFQQSRSAVMIPHDRHTCLVLDKSRYRDPHVDAKLQDVERLYIGTYETPYNNPAFHAFT